MKKNWITWLVILGVIIIAIVVLATKNSHTETPEGISKCIGEKSVLYIQLGCLACEAQKNLFGENIKYLTLIDCFYEKEKCSGIEGTPTWEIKGEKYKGIQSIEKLQELTGC